VLLSIIIFVVFLIILILVHELGHFLIAKLNGVQVKEFAFGFPPTIYSFTRKGTKYSFNLIPLGGYVSLLGEEEDVKTPGSYYSLKVWQKISIVVTGVMMNFLLAIIILTIGFMIGMTPLVSDPATLGGQKTSQVMVAQVVLDSPAAKIGIESGNILNGFSSPSDLQQFTKENAGKLVNLDIQKNGSQEIKPVQLGTNDAPLGVAVVSITKVKQSFPRALVTATVEVGRSIKTVVFVLGGMIKSVFTTGSAGEAGAGVVGPIGIFNFTSEALKIGWIYIFQLLAILSINLGIINILPFPALDGGKILFLALEGIFRKKVVRQEIENLIHTIGFVLLIILLLAITFRDILRFW